MEYNHVINKLIEEYSFNSDLVLLCGSYANGVATNKSDIDVIVIKNSIIKSREFYLENYYSYNIDLIVIPKLFLLELIYYDIVSSKGVLIDLILKSKKIRGEDYYYSYLIATTNAMVLKLQNKNYEEVNGLDSISRELNKFIGNDYISRTIYLSNIIRKVYILLSKKNGSFIHTFEKTDKYFYLHFPKVYNKLQSIIIHYINDNEFEKFKNNIKNLLKKENFISNKNINNLNEEIQILIENREYNWSEIKLILKFKEILKKHKYNMSSFTSLDSYNSYVIRIKSNYNLKLKIIIFEYLQIIGYPHSKIPLIKINKLPYYDKYFNDILYNETLRLKEMLYMFLEKNIQILNEHSINQIGFMLLNSVYKICKNENEKIFDTLRQYFNFRGIFINDLCFYSELEEISDLFKKFSNFKIDLNKELEQIVINEMWFFDLNKLIRSIYRDFTNSSLNLKSNLLISYKSKYNKKFMIILEVINEFFLILGINNVLLINMMNEIENSYSQ